MEMITPARMLMYGKEANNRKQEIDASTTLFRIKEIKDQKTSIVEKSKSFDFPTMPTTTESLSFFISV